MKIIGKKKLLENALFDEDREARRAALNILESALVSVNPRVVIRNHVRRRGNLLFIDNLTFNLEEFERVFVIGGGKASGAMAEAIEEIIGDKISRGIINVLRGTSFKTRKILINEAGHPIPDEAGVEGAKKIVQLAREAEENDLVICLISGGGSALMPLPADGVSLHEKQRLTQELLRCGVAINEINAVRKHISAIKGGQLAKVAYPATVVSLILSDVVGDPLDTIASGPTAPDTTTFADAVSILKKYGLWEVAPDSIRRRLEAGLRGEVAETPKPGDKIFERTYNIIIGNVVHGATNGYLYTNSSHGNQIIGNHFYRYPANPEQMTGCVVLEDSSGNIIANNFIENAGAAHQFRLIANTASRVYNMIIGNKISCEDLTADLTYSVIKFERSGTYVHARNIISNNIVTGKSASVRFNYFIEGGSILTGCIITNNFLYYVNELWDTKPASSLIGKIFKDWKFSENSGIATGLADGSLISHGLIGTPTTVTLTCLNSTYDGVPVIVSWDQQNTDSTHIAVHIYWANGTAITDHVIAVSWRAEYKP